MAEVRVQAEGELRWVQASGTGVAWATASAPQSGIFAYVRSFDFSSAQTHQVINERGKPNHWKHISRSPITINANVDWTGYWPTAITSSAASLPLMNLEFVAREPELGTTPTGRYIQFHGVVIDNVQVTENENANTMALTLQALATNGMTASGYLG